jgi:hypothetical protein
VLLALEAERLLLFARSLLGVLLALAAERLLLFARSRLERLQVYLLKKISKVNAPSN